MSIRARMMAVVFISAMFTVVLVVMLIIAVLMNQRADLCLEDARSVSDAVFELSLLTAEYAVTPTARVTQQWRATYESLGILLDAPKPCAHASLALDESIRPQYKRLGALFDELSMRVEQGTAAGPDGLDTYGVRLASEMRVATQAMAIETVAYRTEIAAGQREAGQRIVALAVLLAVVSIALSSVAAVSIWRFLAEPLAHLRDGARILAAGDLAYRFDIPPTGEIGEVAQAFDDMAGALATSSRALTQEIAERRAAEEAVRRSKRDVERTVERRTAQLVESNIQLVEATAAKDRFMARMSHELRTPLNSIIGFSTVLASGAPGPLTEEQSLQLRMISKSGKRLLSLVNDLLDISVISAGGIELGYEEVDLAALGADIVSTIEPLAAEKNLELHYECRATESIVTDGARLEQVVMNLMGNAVKFTETGNVGLSISTLANGDARFTVTDTGIGIESDRIDDVFTEFLQLTPPTDRVAEGTGLGLAIARNLVYLLSGTISAESIPGEGSTFTVTIPARPA